MKCCAVAVMVDYPQSPPTSTSRWTWTVSSVYYEEAPDEVEVRFGGE